MTEDKKIDAADRAADAVLNQTATMWHERWVAINRIAKLKAEIARRAMAQ